MPTGIAETEGTPSSFNEVVHHNSSKYTTGLLTLLHILVAIRDIHLKCRVPSIYRAGNHPQRSQRAYAARDGVADAPPGHAAAFGAILRCVDALVALGRHATAAVLTAVAGFVSETVCAWCALRRFRKPWSARRVLRWMPRLVMLLLLALS